MQPKLQQLDLFGNPAQDQVGAKEKKKAKAKQLPEPVSIVETPDPAVPTAVLVFQYRLLKKRWLRNQFM
jgi:hypothetical protein